MGRSARPVKLEIPNGSEVMSILQIHGLLTGEQKSSISTWVLAVHDTLPIGSVPTMAQCQ